MEYYITWQSNIYIKGEVLYLNGKVLCIYFAI